MIIQTKQIISEHEWNKVVIKTYHRPYSFQQQDGCKDRGTFYLTVPSLGEDYECDVIPDKINGSERGVRFEAWLARNPFEWHGKPEDKAYVHMFWERNFYPDVQMIANDLHAKGLLPAGEYGIEIDW